jgi:Holliday junction resolvasome RuvABC endonuclease subunit
MKTVLGIDAALKNTGFMLLHDGQPVFYESIATKPGRPGLKGEQIFADDDRRISFLQDYLTELLKLSKQVDIVGIEEPYHAAWIRGKEGNAKGGDSHRLWRLVSRLAWTCGLAGVPVVWVPPADGFDALTGSGDGDKKKHVWMANLRLRGTDLKPLKETQDHIADAFGVALVADRTAVV